LRIHEEVQERINPLQLIIRDRPNRLLAHGTLVCISGRLVEILKSQLYKSIWYIQWKTDFCKFVESSRNLTFANFYLPAASWSGRWNFSKMRLLLDLTHKIRVELTFYLVVVGVGNQARACAHNRKGVNLQMRCFFGDS